MRKRRAWQEVKGEIKGEGNLKEWRERTRDGEGRNQRKEDQK